MSFYFKSYKWRNRKWHLWQFCCAPTSTAAYVWTCVDHMHIMFVFTWKFLNFLIASFLKHKFELQNCLSIKVSLYASFPFTHTSTKSWMHALTLSFKTMPSTQLVTTIQESWHLLKCSVIQQPSWTKHLQHKDCSWISLPPSSSAVLPWAPLQKGLRLPALSPGTKIPW